MQSNIAGSSVRTESNINTITIDSVNLKGAIEPTQFVYIWFNLLINN